MVRSDEFLKSVFRLLDSNPERQGIQLQIAINQTMQMVRGLEGRLERIEMAVLPPQPPQPQQRGGGGVLIPRPGSAPDDSTEKKKWTTSGVPARPKEAGESQEIQAVLRFIANTEPPATTSGVPAVPKEGEKLCEGTIVPRRMTAGQEGPMVSPETPIVPGDGGSCCGAAPNWPQGRTGSAGLQELLAEILRGQESLRKDLAQLKDQQQRPSFSPTIQQVVVTNSALMEPGTATLPRDGSALTNGPSQKGTEEFFYNPSNLPPLRQRSADACNPPPFLCSARLDPDAEIRLQTQLESVALQPRVNALHRA